MVKANNSSPLAKQLALEERAAGIILKAVNSGKTEQETLKVLMTDGIDVRRLPNRFVSSKIEDGLKAARLAARAMRATRKKPTH